MVGGELSPAYPGSSLSFPPFVVVALPGTSGREPPQPKHVHSFVNSFPQCLTPPLPPPGSPACRGGLYAEFGDAMSF